MDRREGVQRLGETGSWRGRLRWSFMVAHLLPIPYLFFFTVRIILSGILELGVDRKKGNDFVYAIIGEFHS
jgi:hypothetical protein